GKVEGQPNGDTIPAEQANPSDDTVAGAGSRQNDQIVQKIEEVLSGALDTELQCKSDVDKNTVKNSTQSTKRSSTAQDEIPRKKSKKNKKHKSKKKKKKKKKRKKEKKHKKQPKESKLSTRHGEHADLQPASHLMPEKSSSKLSVQHGGFGDANLAVHMQPEELCLTASEEPDRQALGLVSHSRTDSQQSTENLGSEKGTLCATNPPFNLEGSQSDIQESATMTQTKICTRAEQIKQAQENIYPIAINVTEKGVLVDTGNETSSSIPSGVANKSEIQKDSAAALASEVIEALKGSEVILKSKGTGEVKALGTALESETMEVLKYSEASLQSVAQEGAKELEATSESVSLASDVATIPKSANQADLNTVKVEITSAKTPLGPGAVTKVKDTEPARSSAHVEDVKALEEALQPIAVVKPKTLETILEPAGVIAKDVKAARECLQVEVVKDMEGTMDPATVLNASGVFLQPKVLTETRTQESALPAELTDVNVVAEAKCLRATSEPVAVVQTFVPQTTPEIQMADLFKGPRATVEVAVLTGVKGQETSQATLQLENTNASKISQFTLKPVAVTEAKDSEGSSLLRQPEELRESRSESESNVRGLEATPLSLQKEDVKGPGGVLRPMAVVEAKTLETASLSLQMEGVKASEEAVHCGTVARGLAATLDSTAVSKGSEINLDSMAGVEAGSDVSLLAMKVGSVRPGKSLETTIGPVAETERKDSEADLDRAGAEMKTSSSHLHVKGLRDLGDPVSVGMAKIQALEAVLQPGTLAVARGLGENVCSEAKMGSKVLEASPGLLALEERSERTPEPVVARVSIEPVRESEAMHLKTTAEREPKHAETVAEPLGASKTKSSIISQFQVMTHTRTSQTEVVGEIKDFELATGSATVEVRGLENLPEVEENQNMQKQLQNLLVQAKQRVPSFHSFRS
ncbi:PREDICTED: protein SON-like, partial [Fulmarus glacialis]|uniref:protein SON-like n=1 Tax=Fulmarus glacialis TaxID=30455 RepID=UPI00051C827E